MPRLCCMESKSVWMSFPPTSIVPDVGGNRPVRIDLAKQHEKQVIFIKNYTAVIYKIKKTKAVSDKLR